MVTTNTNIEEIQELFEEAMRKTGQLASDIETSEEELLEKADELFRMAARAITPVVKYVDQVLDFGWNFGLLRGIEFGTDGVLGRDGKVYLKYASSVPIDLEAYRFRYADFENTYSLMDTVDVIIGFIQDLCVLFVQALEKSDERRTRIAQRSEQLQQATKIFEG